MNEVATLLAVLEDHRRLAVVEPRREDGENACIGIGQSLSWSVCVPEPERHTLHAISGAQCQRQSLLNVFRERVDRGERGLLPLGRRHRDQRAALFVQWIPRIALIRAWRSNNILSDPPIRILIEA